MNYWHSMTCNLFECRAPYFAFLKRLSEKGQKTAKQHYNCHGFCVHHNVDIWENTTPSDGVAMFAFFPMAGVWLIRDLWEYYLFTNDKEFLREFAFEIIELAVYFCVDWLVLNSDGFYVTNPSTSPENRFTDENNNQLQVSFASAIDMTLIA